MSDPVAALVERVLMKAAAAGVKLATAESYTAGRLSTLLADTPGGGKQFRGGFVTYTKQSKIATLGVPWEVVSCMWLPPCAAGACDIDRRHVGGGRDDTRARAIYAALELPDEMLEEMGSSRAPARKGERSMGAGSPHA